MMISPLRMRTCYHMRLGFDSLHVCLSGLLYVHRHTKMNIVQISRSDTSQSRTSVSSCMCASFLLYHSKSPAIMMSRSAQSRSALCQNFPGVDVEAAKRLEEEVIMRDARTWLTEGVPSDVHHPRTGATPLHVAAAKGYLEAIK